MGSRADDVLLLQDCDTGVRKLAEACGWLEELEELWEQTAPWARAGQPKPDKPDDPQMTRDEQLQDEVDKLTEEIDKNLQLTQDQHAWLEGHVDNKFARVQDDEAGKGPTAPLTTGQSLTSEPTADRSDPGGGLHHVFPWLDKKSSL
jgi:NAD-dependent histone deacetylase SIR2